MTTLRDLGKARGFDPDPSPVVGLIGKKRSGKDTFAATLVEEFGFERFAFADPLKRAALATDPIVAIKPNGGPDRLSCVVKRVGWEEAKEIREVRRYLQDFGTEGIRAIQEDFWVRATLDPALLHAKEVGPVVVTDCRYPNEADEIRDAGGTIVRIVRPGQKNDDSHASETAMDNYQEDALVLNSGTLEDLARAAREFASDL